MSHWCRIVLTLFDEEDDREQKGYLLQEEWSETSFELNAEIPLKQINIIVTAIFFFFNLWTQ